MGVSVSGAMLATVIRQTKKQPTQLLRSLMAEMFSSDEMRCSTVRGKRSSLPALDQDVMNAILCKNINMHLSVYTVYTHVGFTMAKAEEWGQPVTEEALVRQGNEKCYQYRKKH